MIGAIVTLGASVIEGITGHFKDKREIKKAVTENKIRLAQSAQTHNQAWEMKQLDNAGWKDDVLFYAFLALFIWTGFDPEGAELFFQNLSILPEWILKTWFWLLAGILGVKKVGDYVPALLKSIKEVVRK